MNKALAQYVNELLTDRNRLLEERKLDKDYDIDKELKEATEHELSVIYQVQKSMDYIEEESI
jgi:hypothetical protein